uniref:Uncharacterized protein LOC108950788 n=1 Tax=Phallusia mammillata TaxID=59560 RepID=A0A6F9DK55_9ASCI|nr:uncharacterized protein LOC108950788 [Phallusia mammillata]
MDPEFVLMNETLDVDEFLCDVSMHLRRRDLRTLLGYIGLSRKEVDSLLYDCKAKTGTERGLLSNTGTVVEGSSLVNFMEQRRKAMQTWWEYAANTKQRNTPAQQRVKVVESSTCALPQIPEHRDVIDGDVIQKDYLELEHQKFPPISPIHLRTHVDHLLKTSEVVKAGTPTIVTDTSQSDDVTYRPTNQESRTTVVQGKTADVSIKSSAGRNSAAGQQPETPRSAGPVVQVPVAEMTDVVGIPHQPNVMSVDAPHEGALTVDRGQQTDLVGCDVSPDQVAILGSSITLEELLRKLWKSLQACGLNKVVEILQQRWLIRVDVNQGGIT